MKTLLRIDSSLRFQDSYSRKMGDYFVEEWLKLNRSGRVINRDVTKNPIPHLTQHTLDGFYDHSVNSEILELSDQLIEELYQCDEILITAPMYNFGMPSSLKAYFDLVVRTGKTFRSDDEHHGLLRNKKAFAITTMGGIKERDAEFNLLEVHLKEIITYLGISEFYPFLIDGTTDKHYAQKISTIQKLHLTNLLNK